jgi:hypothetical protein
VVEIKELACNGWPHCIAICNEHIRLVVTTDVGPRIIHFGPADKDINMFQQIQGQQGLMGGEEWRNYGGHRLWTSPQLGFRPNQADNEPVPYELSGNSIILHCSQEKATLVQKEICITVDPDKPKVTVGHRIYNRGLWPIRFAPWALSVMHEGGVEILPIPQDRPPDYMPNYAICFWPWTKPNDHRFTLGEKYMILRHDKTDESWFKIGFRNTEGWSAYISDGYMFVKTYKPLPGEYPDYGSTFETYMDNIFTEIETLGPLETVDPEMFLEHIEQWHLFGAVSVPKTEKEIEAGITRHIRGILS